jgi:hypothetical protein
MPHARRTKGITIEGNLLHVAPTQRVIVARIRPTPVSSLPENEHRGWCWDGQGSEDQEGEGDLFGHGRVRWAAVKTFQNGDTKDLSGE